MKRILAHLALLLIPSAAAFAADENWPSKPVRMVVPYSAGSTADMVGRLLGERLAARFKQPFVVDNRPGGGGEVGTLGVARSPADGHTLLLTTAGPLVVSPGLNKNLAYDTEKDFAPIAELAWIPLVLVSHPSFPARTLPELIAVLKANPGKYAYASSGNGSYAHISMEMFKQATGVFVTHIPYRGPAQAEADLVGGQVSLMFTGISTVNPLIQAGRLTTFGVSSRTRSSFAPSIPTLMEQGLKALNTYEVTSRTVLMAPANTPAAIVNQLNAEINAALKSPDFREKLTAKSLLAPESTSPPEVTATLRREKTLWAKVIETAKIRPD